MPEQSGEGERNPSPPGAGCRKHPPPPPPGLPLPRGTPSLGPGLRPSLPPPLLPGPSAASPLRFAHPRSPRTRRPSGGLRPAGPRAPLPEPGPSPGPGASILGPARRGAHLHAGHLHRHGRVGHGGLRRPGAAGCSLLSASLLLGGDGGGAWKDKAAGSGFSAGRAPSSPLSSFPFRSFPSLPARPALPGAPARPPAADSPRGRGAGAELRGGRAGRGP